MDKHSSLLGPLFLNKKSVVDKAPVAYNRKRTVVGWAPALLTNIRCVFKVQYARVLVPIKPVANIIKLFTAVSYDLS